MKRCMWLRETLGAILLASIACSSCSSLYIRPVSLDTVAVHKSAPPASVGDRPSISVREAAQMAIDFNLELRAEREALEARTGAWKLGLRAFLPSLTLGGTVDERLALYAQDSLNTNVSLTLEQRLWDGGRLAASRKLESAELELALVHLERKADEVGEAAVAVYRRVVVARKRLEIQRGALQAATLERTILAAELTAGLATSMDLLVADLELKRQDIEVQEAAVVVDMAEDELAAAIGLMDVPILADAMIDTCTRLALNVDSLRLLAVTRSTELEAARAAIVRKQAEALAAGFSWLPELGLRASAWLSGAELPLTDASWSIGLNIDFGGAFLSGSAGVEISGETSATRSAHNNWSAVPIPDPAAALDRKNTQLALRLAEDGYRALVDRIDREARAAALGYESAVEITAVRAAALEAAKAARELSKLRVQLGQSARSELIKAELELATYETELVDS
ncbi:MAG: TolC family protein, partial [Spirochaetales bacterium]|nr:TolC family protein [Spirochaetales bacterium]